MSVVFLCPDDSYPKLDIHIQ